MNLNLKNTLRERTNKERPVLKLLTQALSCRIKTIKTISSTFWLCQISTREHELHASYVCLTDALAQERAEEVHEEDQEVRPHCRLLHPVRQALCQQQDLCLQ